MTRVLQRPMFKMGGSTSGITSGLDRPGYSHGKTVSPSQLTEYIQTIKGMGGPRTPPLSDFLMNFGLNLMTASPRGNIFTTAAESAKEPVKRLQQSSADERSLNMNLAAKAMDMFKDSGDIELQKKVEYLIDLEKYPDTHEGRLAAADFILRSKTDPANWSRAAKFEDKKDELLRLQEVGTVDELERRASFEVDVKPALLKKVGNAYKGVLKTSAGGLRKQAKRDGAGSYYYDKNINEVVRYDGGETENGIPQLIRIDQTTFEDIEEDPADNANINPALPKKTFLPEEPLLKDQITDITGIY